MKTRTFAQNLALVFVFLGVGMTIFTEDVRTVQVLGLYVSGVASGVFLARAIIAAKLRQAESTAR